MFPTTYSSLAEIEAKMCVFFRKEKSTLASALVFAEAQNLCLMSGVGGKEVYKVGWGV